MQNINQIMALDGSIFEMDVIDVRYASTKQKGYIILPDGRLVVVPFDRSHGSVFSEFLIHYLGFTQKLDVNGVNGSRLLAQYNCITYMCTSQHQRISKMETGFGDSSMLYDCDGTFSLMNEIENITDEQVNVLLTLINENYSISGVERVNLHFGIISKELDFDKTEFIQFLEGKKIEANFTR